jgi:hypothetical protein
MVFPYAYNAIPFFPLLMVALWKRDMVLSLYRHVRKNYLTGAEGKFMYGGIHDCSVRLDGIALSEDPARFALG